jgi:hypothetical protein
MLTMSIQAHHSLADAIHASKFFNNLQRELSSPEEIFKNTKKRLDIIHCPTSIITRITRDSLV